MGNSNKDRMVAALVEENESLRQAIALKTEVLRQQQTDHAAQMAEIQAALASAGTGAAGPRYRPTWPRG